MKGPSKLLIAAILACALCVACKPANAAAPKQPTPNPEPVLVARDYLPNGLIAETWVLSTGRECVFTYANLGSLSSVLTSNCDWHPVRPQ